MHSDRPHYYLCTLIKGEGKLFINHMSPKGCERDEGREGAGGDGKEGSKTARDVGDKGAPGLVFLRSATQISNQLVHHSCSTNTSVLVSRIEPHLWT